MLQSGVSEKYSYSDYLALLLLIVPLAVACLYPEIFITGMPVLDSQHTLPLTLLLPLFSVGAFAYWFYRRPGLSPGIMDAVLLAFFAYIFARNVTGPFGIYAVKYSFYGLGLFYVASILTVRRADLSLRLVYAITAITVVTVIYGLIEYGFQSNVLFREFLSETVLEPAVGIHRIGSTMGHPVPYGAYLIQALPFSVLVWIAGGSRRLRTLGASATMLVLLALIFTYSKGSWIVAALLGLTAAIWFGFGRGRRILIPAAIGLAGLALSTGIFWQEIRAETLMRAGNSVEIRLISWEAAAQGFKDNPLFGVGLRRGEQELVKYLDPEWMKVSELKPPVDNYYLSLLLEEGVIGFLFWVLLIAVLVYEGIGSVARNGPHRLMGLAALVSILGLLLNTVTFEALHIWPNFVLFWIAAGTLHGLFLMKNYGRQPDHESLPAR